MNPYRNGRCKRISSSEAMIYQWTLSSFRSEVKKVTLLGRTQQFRTCKSRNVQEREPTPRLSRAKDKGKEQVSRGRAQ
jgi:hypothetical protein